MKYSLEQLTCPSCGAGIEMDIQGRKAIFCPFCGSQFAIDDGERIITHNINIHKRYTDDAGVEKQKRKSREAEYQHKEMIALILISFCLVIVGVLGSIIGPWWENKQMAETGRIKVGQTYGSMIGKNYKAVVEQLDSAGFTNITTVDLNDDGLLFNKKDTVESITIGGETKFSDTDLFDPNSKVVISYH